MLVLKFVSPILQFPTYECDVVVVGSAKVGKTTLCMRIHTGCSNYQIEDVPQVF